MSAVRALLFDLDGTLLDSDRLHFVAFQRLLAEQDGRSLSHEAYARDVIGGANAAIMRRLFPDRSVEEHRRLADHKEAIFRESLAREPQPPRPGLGRLLDWAEANRVATCIVSNAPRVNVQAMLDSLGLAERLPHRVHGEELARGKPDPLPYLEALRQLGVAPGEAFAFEDSGAGVTAAARAGLRTFAVLGWLDEAALRAAGATDVIADFDDARLWRALEGDRPVGQ